MMMMMMMMMMTVYKSAYRTMIYGSKERRAGLPRISRIGTEI